MRSAPGACPGSKSISRKITSGRFVRSCRSSSGHAGRPRRGWDGQTERRRAFERRAGVAAPGRWIPAFLPTRHEADDGAGRSARSRDPDRGAAHTRCGSAAGRGARWRDRAAERAARAASASLQRRGPGRELAPSDRLVAIVATSDDGGSSGKLRAEFNIIPPGDIRNCLAALSDNHALIADIFQYRFGSGDGLNGHTLGNLVLTALADVMNDFPRAVEIAARVVGAHGTVLPATSEVVTLVAEFEDGRVLSGESAIAAAGGRIARVSLIPERPRFLPRPAR